MVTLFIGGLMLAVVPPLLSGVGLTTELRSSARQLAAGLRMVRNDAITQQREAILTVNLEQREFVAAGKRRRLPDDDDVELRLYTAQSELIDETSGTVRFFPDGSSTGGHIALSDGRIEYRVNIDWLTGRVIVDDRPVQ